MKKVILLLMVSVLAGCATHAEIKMPVVVKIHDTAYENKSLNYEILYSQPKPGIFTGGEQLPLAPLEEAELSVASASTLKELPKLIFEQLPISVKYLVDNPDLTLKIELTAYNKLGPAYADYEFAKSLGKDLLTLGFASSEYDIIADFDARYILQQKGEVIFSKNFKVRDQVDHERGDFESYNTLNDFTSQILEKHLILTLHAFFKDAAVNVKG
ncbi:hypothetical protein [uncultured Psychromonas sp.]|uniref:hypothetical protein n=1 Tax=uncultured Psychromonas sp. TaxID=173974 RepID=UPI00261AAC1E|nr:hypothetical protein [uncultured Psychromonas sp.]